MKKLTTIGHEFNEVDIYAMIMPQIKVFDIERNIKLKRMTIEGSYYTDEFRVLSDTQGYHTSASGARLCDYKIVEVEKESWGGDYIEKQVVTTSNDFLDYETFKELVIKNNHATKQEMEKYENDWLEKQRNSGYKNMFEFSMNEKKLEIYIEFDNECYSLKLYKNNKRGQRHSSNELYINGLYFNGDDLKKEVENTYINKVFGLVDKGVKRISNGYIYNNKYYEELEDVKEVIKKENENGKSKKL